MMKKTDQSGGEKAGKRFHKLGPKPKTVIGVNNCDSEFPNSTGFWSWLVSETRLSQRILRGVMKSMLEPTSRVKLYSLMALIKNIQYRRGKSPLYPQLLQRAVDEINASMCYQRITVMEFRDALESIGVPSHKLGCYRINVD